MRRLARILGFLAALLCVTPTPARAEEIVRIGGTGTALGVMARLGKAFRTSNPGVRVIVFPSLGSSGAIEAVSQGALDIAVSGRPLTKEEHRPDIASFEFARTPFLFGANLRAGVKGITSDEAVRIYRGDAVRWPNGERIRLVLRPATDVDTLILRGISPQMSSAVDAALARPGMLMSVTNQDCNTKVTRTPGAIGPTTLLQVRTEPRPMTALRWNGVEPTVAKLSSGAYPLVKHLYLIVRTSPHTPVRRFVQFLRTPRAKKILEDAGAEVLGFRPLE